MDTLTLGYVLIVIGLALLVAEVFIPSAGVLGILSAVALVVGITLIFTVDTTAGVGTVALVAVAVPLILAFWRFVFPKTPLGRRLFLEAPADDATLANSPVNLELEQLRGRYGKTASALRPAGITVFDGKRVDTLSEGPMIGPDQWVQCVDVQAGKVIVRQVAGPPRFEDLNTTDLPLQ